MDILDLREALYRRLIAPEPLTGKKPYRKLTPKESEPIRKLADVVAEIMRADAVGLQSATEEAYESVYQDAEDELRRCDSGDAIRISDSRLSALAAVFTR